MGGGLSCPEGGLRASASYDLPARTPDTAMIGRILDHDTNTEFDVLDREPTHDRREGFRIRDPDTDREWVVDVESVVSDDRYEWLAGGPMGGPDGGPPPV
jgi:hypothetical protein